jgi:hypothetical protein
MPEFKIPQQILETGFLSLADSIISGSLTLASGALVFPDGTEQTTAGGGGGSGTPGGSTGQIQYNNNGAFGGTSTITFVGDTLRATGSFSGSLTGQLLGTASFVTGSIFTGTNIALSSSFTISSSIATSASFAISSSNATSASFVTGSIFTGTNIALSSSFTISSSRATSSSFAQVAAVISGSAAITAGTIVGLDGGVGSTSGGGTQTLRIAGGGLAVAGDSYFAADVGFNSDITVGTKITAQNSIDGVNIGRHIISLPGAYQPTIEWEQGETESYKFTAITASTTITFPQETKAIAYAAFLVSGSTPSEEPPSITVTGSLYFTVQSASSNTYGGWESPGTVSNVVQFRVFENTPALGRQAQPAMMTASLANYAGKLTRYIVYITQQIDGAQGGGITEMRDFTLSTCKDIAFFEVSASILANPNAPLSPNPPAPYTN